MNPKTVATPAPMAKATAKVEVIKPAPVARPPHSPEQVKRQPTLEELARTAAFRKKTRKAPPRDPKGSGQTEAVQMAFDFAC